MSKQSHTPSREILEYEAYRQGGEIIIELGIGVAIADPSDELNDIEALENTARLIAAAPELLSCLQTIVSEVYSGRSPVMDDDRMIRALGAIDSALGRVK